MLDLKFFQGSCRWKWEHC